MGKAWGNAMWPSTAKENGQPINNLPGLYPTEDWTVHYWDVAPRGELRSLQAVIQLPRGYSDACPGVRIGENGCVHNVRRWGVQCYTRILQDIGFDPFAYLSQDAESSAEGENGEMVSILIHATHFCLPGHFTVASDEHPLLLFDPLGDLKGSCTHWLDSMQRTRCSTVKLWPICGRLCCERVMGGSDEHPWSCHPSGSLDPVGLVHVGYFYLP